MIFHPGPRPLFGALEGTVQFIFHIGQQKTASTAIQSHLAYNRKRLADQGVLYPLALGSSKATLITGLLTRKSGLASSRETILSNLDAELSKPYSRVLFSNENLFGWNSLPTIPHPLKEAFARYATSWRVLCYVRRPDEHLVSLYQQNVKGGLAGTLDQFFEERLDSFYYSYARRMEQWAKTFGEDAVEVRLFHRQSLKGAPFDDFTQWLGLDPAALPPSPEERANESLDRVNTEVLRLLNLCRAEQPDLLRGLDTKRIVRRMRAFDTGDRWRLDSERARRLQERFRDDHESLARRYLSDADAALLLAPPPEVPPQPPLGRDALFGRVMALFNNPALARLAVEMSDKPTGLLRASRKSKAKREAKAARIVRQFDRSSKLHYALAAAVLDRLRQVTRKGQRIARSIASAIRPN